MRLVFRASEGGFTADRDGSSHCLICGVSGRDSSGAEHYVILQRSFEDENPSEDWGVHCEYDDQSNGDYNCVRRCRLTRSRLEVDLTEVAGYEYSGLSVDISSLDDDAFEAMQSGLPRIFRGMAGILEIA